MSRELKKYTVWLRTKPGMCEQYDGKVEVFAENYDQALDRAFSKLRNGIFPDYSRDLWNVERVHVKPA